MVKSNSFYIYTSQIRPTCGQKKLGITILTGWIKSSAIIDTGTETSMIRLSDLPRGLHIEQTRYTAPAANNTPIELIGKVDNINLTTNLGILIIKSALIPRNLDHSIIGLPDILKNQTLVQHIVNKSREVLM